MSVELPLCINPRIKDNHDSAFSLSILEKHESFSNKWIIEKFMILKYKKYLTYNNPFQLYWKCFKSKIIIFYKNKNIINIIKKQLSRGRYVHVQINEKYIPNRLSYKKFDYSHNLLIYGFNESGKIYTIAYNADGHYTTQEICENQLFQAYKECKDFPIGQIYTFNVRKNFDFNSLDVKKLKKLAKRYLNPRNSKTGINAYNYLLNDIKTAIAKELSLDMRSFRTLFEHAETILSIHEHFSLSSSLVSRMKKNASLSKMLFYTALKYEMYHDKASLNEVLKCFLVYYEEEKKILQEIINSL